MTGERAVCRDRDGGGTGIWELRGVLPGDRGLQGEEVLCRAGTSLLWAAEVWRGGGEAGWT